MKNVFFIVIDSFLYNKIGNCSYGNSPTPFLDEIKKQSLFVSNLYSQGPYTEAGNKALLTGSDSLIHGGYMHNLNQSRDIYLDVFKKNGYFIIEYFLPYYLYSNKDFENIDIQYFTSDFIFNSVWSNRLKHFKEVKEKEKLSESDYYDIFTQLDLTFQAWGNFLENDNKEKYKYIERIISDYDFEGNYSLLIDEKKKYTQSPKEYADRLLDMGSEHELFKIQNLNYSNYLDFDFFRQHFYEKNVDLVNKIRKKQFLYNLRNNHINVYKAAASLFKKSDEYYRSVLFSLGSGFLANQYKKKGQFLQSLPSCRSLLRGCLQNVQEYSGNKPLFIHVHPEDLHNRTSFLTYDIFDVRLLDHEVTLMKDYIGSLNKNYRGELVYDLALVYIDDCIKEFVNGLKKMGKLSDSVIIITSDHGYSYDCVPLRNRFVNNHHSENYHIPAFFYDNGNHKGVIESYHTSKDVLPTIYSLCGIGAPVSINGRSILHYNEDNAYAISEYLGGGCPDMRRRPIQYMIRNKEWLLVYYVKLFDDFEAGEVVELYNLKDDPKELNNLNKAYELVKVQPLLTALKEHHQFLQNNQ